ncbi:DUF1624 domain-containing protein [Rubrolithibacter danxiaensis]|uniref:DUF1624 domain-containing protein n=1 Tax=Rubrolithibacter danxiaensis TaxID=3390805 RepID=UPI003BF77401
MTDLKLNRITSIDILRGLVMVIMALDHVRDFFHEGAMTGDPLNLQTTTPLLFFTRWITHFCAPVFVFLSGISAGLSAQKKSQKETAAFLIKRGFWLIVVEIVVISLALTFNPFYNFIILEVIWAIGCSMVVLGILLYVSKKLIPVIGVILVFGHNIFDYIHPPETGFSAVLMKVFFTSRGYVLPLSANHILGIFYTVLPWTGAMLLGFSIAKLYTDDYSDFRRRKLLLYAGFAVITFFIVLRFINFYGDPFRWETQKSILYTLLSFINTSKYPPSLLYLCMTIGPALILLALLENTRNKFLNILSVYGKVPFFYFVLHLYIIHTLTVIFFYVSGYSAKDIVSPGIPFLFRPAAFGYPLGIVYIIWICIVSSLYFPCKWFYRYKQLHKEKWWTHYL